MMGLLNVFKKKKKSLDLPLPPLPLGNAPKELEPDIPTIRAREESVPPELKLPAMPEFPAFPPEESELVEEPAKPVEREMSGVLDEEPTELFVSVDDYRAVVQDATAVRSKLMEVESVLKNMQQLQNDGERLLDRWSKELADVERKLSRVDTEIAKAQL